MRTSAITRIILFSIAIFLLLGVLSVGLGITAYMTEGVSHHYNEVSHAPEQLVSSSCTADPDTVRKIQIEWAAGHISIEPSQEQNQIQIAETAPEEEEYRMVCKQSGDTLSIQFCKESIRFPSFGINVDFSKDLTILVPADWVCQSLEIDAASADVLLRNMDVRELDFDGASGSCSMVSCNIGSMDLDAASGDVSFSGCLDSLDFDGASADCTLVLANCPDQIDLDGMSGKLDITLPSDCGFTVHTQGLSCKFSTDFDVITQESGKQNGYYRHGDGGCRIGINALSGSIDLHDGGYLHHTTAADCPDTEDCAIHSEHQKHHH